MISTSQFVAPSENPKQVRSQEVLRTLRVAEGEHSLSYAPSSEEFERARHALRARFHTSGL